MCRSAGCAVAAGRLRRSYQPDSPIRRRKRRQGAGLAPCAGEAGLSLVARGGLAVAALVLGDRPLQVGVFLAAEEARLVERGEALLGTVELPGLQIELARVLERAE